MNQSVEKGDADHPAAMARLAGAASRVAEAIDNGVLDPHLPPIIDAVCRRLDELLRRAEADAKARIAVGDRVQLGSMVRPTYLEGATATVTGRSDDGILIRLDRPAGRYPTDVDIRLSPLGVRSIAEQPP